MPTEDISTRSHACALALFVTIIHFHGYSKVALCYPTLTLLKPWQCKNNNKRQKTVEEQHAQLNAPDICHVGGGVHVKVSVNINNCIYLCL